MRFLLAGIDFDFSREWLDYSILDLKDGVVEEYEYDDLKSIIDTTGVKISTGCLKDVIKPCSDLIYDVDNIYMYNGLCKYTSFSLGGENFFVRLQLCREKNKFIIEIFKLRSGCIFRGEITATNKYYNQVIGDYEDVDNDFGLNTAINVVDVNDNKVDFKIEEYFTLCTYTKHNVEKIVSIAFNNGKFKGIKDTEFKVRY